MTVQNTAFADLMTSIFSGSRSVGHALVVHLEAQGPADLAGGGGTGAPPSVT